MCCLQNSEHGKALAGYRGVVEGFKWFDHGNLYKGESGQQACRQYLLVNPHRTDICCCFFNLKLYGLKNWYSRLASSSEYIWKFARLFYLEGRSAREFKSNWSRIISQNNYPSSLMLKNMFIPIWLYFCLFWRSFWIHLWLFYEGFPTFFLSLTHNSMFLQWITFNFVNIFLPIFSFLLIFTKS